MKLVNYIAAVALMSSLSVLSTNGMDSVKASTNSELSNLFSVVENGSKADLYEALKGTESNGGAIIISQQIIDMMSSKKVSNDERIQLAVALLKRECIKGDGIAKILNLPKYSNFEPKDGITYTSDQIQSLVDQLIDINPNSQLFRTMMPYDIGYALLYSNQLNEEQTLQIKKWVGLLR